MAHQYLLYPDGCSARIVTSRCPLDTLYVGVRVLRARNFPILPTLMLGVLLMIGSTAIACWQIGFEVPLNFGEEIYYRDMLRIDDPISLVHDYESLQQTVLYKHARTNPPGALINIYLLNQLVHDPGIISLIILITTGWVSGYFLYSIIRIMLPDDSGLAGYATLLFLSIPAVQVYYTHGVDPIVATLLLGTIYCVLHPRPQMWIGAVGFLFWATFTSFLSIFILSILGGLFLCHRQYRLRILGIISATLVLYIGVYALLNYNYVNSFLIASAFENPDGMRLFSDTPTYISTRFESIAEILLFFSPFLVVYLLHGVPKLWREQSVLLTLSGFAMLSFVGLMLFGVMSTGEAARAMVFVYPYLMFPVIYAIREYPQYRTLLVCLVFGQTLFMQTVGIYFA